MPPKAHTDNSGRGGAALVLRLLGRGGAAAARGAGCSVPQSSPVEPSPPSRGHVPLVISLKGGTCVALGALPPPRSLPPRR